MPAPTILGSTTGTAAGTTSSTVTLAATAADDILVMIWVNGGATATPTLTTGTLTVDTGWTLIDSGTWTTGAGGCHWVRCTGNHSGQTQIITGLTNSCALKVITVRGCVTSGSPIDVSSGTTGAAANGTLGAITTTVPDTCLILTTATDDNQGVTNLSMGGVQMVDDFTNAPSSGGTDSNVCSASVRFPAQGTTGSFAVTEAAGTAEGKRITAMALKSAPGVIPDQNMGEWVPGRR